MKRLTVLIILFVMLVGTVFAEKVKITDKTFAVTTKEEFIEYFEYFSQFYLDNCIEITKEAENIKDINKYGYLIHYDNDHNAYMFFYSKEFDKYFKIYFYRRCYDIFL